MKEGLLEHCMTEPQLSSTFSHTLLEKIYKMDFLSLKEKGKKIHKGHQKSIRAAQLVNILKFIVMQVSSSTSFFQKDSRVSM